MLDNELLALIGQHEKSALGSSVSMGSTVGSVMTTAMNTLEVDRYNALNAYYARPMGNEIADRSSIVIPELRDTVEWVMPQLMRMFAATTKICQFDAVNGNDEDQADVETDVVNHVFMKQNEGFFILHDMFKDALLLRNGYAKVYWDKQRKSEIESYTGLSESEVTQLLSEKDDDEIEILGQNEYQTLLVTPMGPQPITNFDIRIRRTSIKGKVKIECIPPEEILVSTKARHGFENVPFIEHKTKVTRSTLIEMGYDTSKLDTISKGSPDWLNLVALARNEVTDQLAAEDWTTDKATTDIDLREVYMLVDYDDDDIAELRRIMVAGDVIVENEECEEVPIVYCSPIRMPHRHVGISYYDILYDLQVLKTTLFRNGLDNLYATNNERTAINTNNVNLDDLLVTRPGGVVRVTGAPQENIMQMGAQGSMMQQVIPAMEYVDNMREMRTGIGKDTMGVDADALQDVTKGGQLAAMSAAAMKVELVARLLGEGVKDLFQKIHNTLIRHQDQEMTVAIAGKWVDVNPSEWRSRAGVTVNVGLGSGNRDEARANVSMLMALQEKIAPFGLVGPKQAYASFRKAVHLLGEENPNQYAIDPGSPEFAQHQQQMQSQPNPEIMKIQAQAQADQQATQAKIQADQQHAAAQAHLAGVQQAVQAQQVQQEQELEAKRQALQSEHDAQLKQLQIEADEREATAKLQMEQLQIEADHQLKQAEMAHEFQMEQLRIQSEQEIEKYKADLAASTQITTAEISSKTTLGSSLMAAEKASNITVTKDMPTPPDAKLSAIHEQTIDAIRELTQTLGKPRKLIRGPDGKAQGVE